MNHACAAQVLGRPLPRSIKRTATLALALSRVAWHHVAYSAPNVYGLLSVELLANGLVSERWLPGQHKRAKFPTSKAPISAVFHSFRLIFGRAIVSRNGLDAWMLFS